MYMYVVLYMYVYLHDKHENNVIFQTKGPAGPTIDNTIKLTKQKAKSVFKIISMQIDQD
jgi:hypothetical protein